MKHLALFSSFLLLLFLASCNQDEDILVDVEIDNPTHTTYVNAGFNGYVTDVEGNAIEGAIVHINDATSTTEVDGYYTVTGNVSQAGAYLRVTKDGYFEAYANVTPTLGKKKQVRFTLLERSSLF